MDAINPPRRAWEILNAWLSHPGATAAFARRYFPRAEVIVAGHFHWPGLWRRDGRVVINTGAFVAPHPAWWCEWHRGWLRCGRVIDGPPWRMGGATGTWRIDAQPSRS